MMAMTGYGGQIQYACRPHNEASMSVLHLKNVMFNPDEKLIVSAHKKQWPVVKQKVSPYGLFPYTTIWLISQLSLSFTDGWHYLQECDRN